MKDSASSSEIVVAATSEPGTFTVEVRSRETTRHRVSVSPTYLRELGIEAIEPARVLHEAFVFLLEREPNTSVLPRFDLRDIERYFPDFRDEIVPRMRR